MARHLFAVNLKITLSSELSREYRVEELKRRWPTCSHCGSPATKEAVYKEDGIIVLVKYCDACITDAAKFKEIQKVQRWAARLVEKSGR